MPDVTTTESNYLCVNVRVLQFIQHVILVCAVSQFPYPFADVSGIAPPASFNPRQHPRNRILNTRAILFLVFQLHFYFFFQPFFS